MIAIPGTVIGAGGNAAWRHPNSLIARDVCPHCKRETIRHGFTSPEGHWLETHHCIDHGDVAPMRSHIVRQESAR